MKKSIVAFLLAALACLSLAACDSDKAQHFEPGETIVTTAVEIDVKGVEFANRVSLDAGDLYKGNDDPNVHRGLVAGDSELCVVMEMGMKNIATGSMFASDIFERMAIVCADEYRYSYDDCAWLGAAIPMDGAFAIEPLVTEPYRVIFSCSKEVLNEGEPLYLELSLDNGNTYRYPLH